MFANTLTEYLVCLMPALLYAKQANYYKYSKLNKPFVVVLWPSSKLNTVTYKVNFRYQFKELHTHLYLMWGSRNQGVLRFFIDVSC